MRSEKLQWDQVLWAFKAMPRIFSFSQEEGEQQKGWTDLKRFSLSNSGNTVGKTEADPEPFQATWWIGWLS